MRKIYKLYIGIILSVIAVACSDNLDSDKYFKDRRSLEDVFTDKESTEEWLAHAYSFLGGYNLEVSNMLNTMRIRRSRPVLMMRVTVIRGAIVIKVFVKHLSSSKILI